MSARPDDTCPGCGEPLLRDEVDIGVGIQYSAPWCSDQECGWEPRGYEMPPDIHGQGERGEVPV